MGRMLSYPSFFIHKTSLEIVCLIYIKYEQIKELRGEKFRSLNRVKKATFYKMLNIK